LRRKCIIFSLKPVAVDFVFAVKNRRNAVMHLSAVRTNGA